MMKKSVLFLLTAVGFVAGSAGCANIVKGSPELEGTGWDERPAAAKTTPAVNCGSNGRPDPKAPGKCIYNASAAILASEFTK